MTRPDAHRLRFKDILANFPIPASFPFLFGTSFLMIKQRTQNKCKYGKEVIRKSIEIE